MRQPGIHGECHVRTGHIFFERHRQDVRHALPAIFDRCRKRAPASFAIGLIRFLETVRRCHRTVGMTGAPLFVAHDIQGEKLIFDKFRAFGQDRLDHVGAGIFETRQIGIFVDAQNFVENEKRIAQRRLILRHMVL